MLLRRQKDRTHRDMFTQLGKSDGIRGFQFENKRLAMAVHRVFEFRSIIHISLIECNPLVIVERGRSCDTISSVKLHCINRAQKNARQPNNSDPRRRCKK